MLGVNYISRVKANYLLFDKYMIISSYIEAKFYLKIKLRWKIYE